MSRQAPSTCYRCCSLAFGSDEFQSLRVRCHLPRTSMWAVSPGHKARANQKAMSAMTWEDAPPVRRDSPVGQPPATNISESVACRMLTASPLSPEPLVCQRRHCLSPHLARPAAGLNPNLTEAGNGSRLQLLPAQQRCGAAYLAPTLRQLHEAWACADSNYHPVKPYH